MELSTLTRSELIFIDPPFASPEETIRSMAQALFEQGLISDSGTFIASVLRRESEGPTALGEALAVPHGKCASVRQAAFSVAVFKNPILWPGLEGEEAVRLVFLLAIPPQEAGSTHMQLLTQLTSSLVDDRVREAILQTATAPELLALLTPPNAPVSAKPEAQAKSSRLTPLILGLVTAAAFINAGIHWLNS